MSKPHSGMIDTDFARYEYVQEAVRQIRAEHGDYFLGHPAYSEVIGRIGELAREFAHKYGPPDRQLEGPSTSDESRESRVAAWIAIMVQQPEES